MDGLPGFPGLHGEPGMRGLQGNVGLNGEIRLWIYIIGAQKAKLKKMYH